MVTIERRQDPAAVRCLLEALPDWFGIEEALNRYVATARKMPSYLAVEDGRVVGAALVHRHFPQTAELHLIAVDPAAHGSGIGTELLTAIEADLRADGVQLLTVKTVGPSFRHDGYAATRNFYARRGFAPIVEIEGLDWNGPTLISVKALA